MLKLLTDVELWNAARTEEITVPISLIGAVHSFPKVNKSLNKPWSMSFELTASSALATASSSEAYYLSKRKIIRFIYDDDSIEEWRISGKARQTSGKDNFKVQCEPIWQDLQVFQLRQALTTGVVRTNVNFYGQTVDEILTAILSPSYNCPALYTKGTIDSSIGAKEVRLEFNGHNFMQALNTIAKQAGAEWGISYDAINDDYEIDFYKVGDLGGGIAEASDRLIQMGNNKGNRENLLVKNTPDSFYSKIIGIAGSGNDTVTIAGLEFTATALTSSTTSVLSIDKPLIVYDGLPLLADETLYFGNPNDGWNEVVSTDSTNQRITITGSIGGVSAQRTGFFSVGEDKVQLSYLESPDAVNDIGIVEQGYRRTDINPYSNLLEEAGITVDFSNWDSGLPVGVTKIGSSTVEEETGDLYTKFGAKSAKVSADTDEGITCSLDVDPSKYPYFSLISYFYVESGNIKMEFVDDDGSVLPEGQFAETNEANIQGLSLSGIKPVSGTATINITATEDSTVFYIDAWVLTNSSSIQQFSPLMGKVALWREMAKELQKTGGLLPDEYTGEFWDDAYSDPSALEVEIGSWVTVKDGWNGTTFDIDFVGRVIDLEYSEHPVHGRLVKNAQISNKPKDLNNFLSNTFVTNQSVQSGTEVGVANSINALELALKNGGITIDREGNLFVNTLYIGSLDNSIRYDSETGLWSFITDGSKQIFSTNDGITEFVNTNVEFNGNSVQINTNVGFFEETPSSQKTVTGDSESNSALESLITQLAAYGLIIDGTI